MEQLILSLNLEEAKACLSILKNRIEMLTINENITMIKNTVDKQGYCVFFTRYTIKDVQVMPIPIKVCATTYDKFGGEPKDYTIESSYEQYDWYDILNHTIGDAVPEDASITSWSRNSDWDDPISGSGVGHVYLYHNTANRITADTKCLVVTDEGDILKSHEQLDKCNELIRLNKAAPIFL